MPAAARTPVATKTNDVGSGTGAFVSPVVNANVYTCPNPSPSPTAFSTPVGVKFTASRLAVNDRPGEIGGTDPRMETSAKDVKSGMVSSTSVNTNPLKGAPPQPRDSPSMVMNPSPMSIAPAPLPTRGSSTPGSVATTVVEKMLVPASGNHQSTPSVWPSTT